MKEDRRLIVETFFIKYKDIFKGSGVDRWLGFPEGTMQKFFKYGIPLNRNRINKAYRELKNLIEYVQELKQGKPE